jgi:hypothetical protein
MSASQSGSLSSTKLNAIQLHLLELFAGDMTEQDLQEIKALLVEYYNRKAEEELDRIWDNRNYTPQSFSQATENLHLRAKK